MVFHGPEKVRLTPLEQRQRLWRHERAWPERPSHCQGQPYQRLYRPDRRSLRAFSGAIAPARYRRLWIRCRIAPCSKHPWRGVGHRPCPAPQRRQRRQHVRHRPLLPCLPHLQLRAPWDLTCPWLLPLAVAVAASAAAWLVERPCPCPPLAEAYSLERALYRPADLSVPALSARPAARRRMAAAVSRQCRQLRLSG